MWTEITRANALSETFYGLYKTGINEDSVRAQDYDGAVKLSGCHRGVQAKIIVKNENCEFLQNLCTDNLVALSLETPWVITLFSLKQRKLTQYFVVHFLISYPKATLW